MSRYAPECVSVDDLRICDDYRRFLESEYCDAYRRRHGAQHAVEPLRETDLTAILLERAFGSRAVELIGGAAAVAAGNGMADLTDLWCIDFDVVADVWNAAMDILKPGTKHKATLSEIARGDDEFCDWLD